MYSTYNKCVYTLYRCIYVRMCITLALTLNADGSERAGHFVKSLDKNVRYFTPDPMTRRNAVVVPLDVMQCK